MSMSWSPSKWDRGALFLWDNAPMPLPGWFMRESMSSFTLKDMVESSPLSFSSGSPPPHWDLSWQFSYSTANRAGWVSSKISILSSSLYSERNFPGFGFLRSMKSHKSSLSQMKSLSSSYTWSYLRSIRDWHSLWWFLYSSSKITCLAILVYYILLFTSNTVLLWIKSNSFCLSSGRVLATMSSYISSYCSYLGLLSAYWPFEILTSGRYINPFSKASAAKGSDGIMLRYCELWWWYYTKSSDCRLLGIELLICTREDPRLSITCSYRLGIFKLLIFLLILGFINYFEKFNGLGVCEHIYHKFNRPPISKDIKKMWHTKQVQE